MVKNTGSNSNPNSLITILRDKGVLTHDQCEEINNEGFSQQQEIEDYLQGSCGVTQQDITIALAMLAKVPVISLQGLTNRGDFLREFPAEMLKRHRAVPIAKTTKTLTLALADPLDIFAVEELANFTGLTVLPVAALERELRDLISSLEQEGGDELDEMLQQAGDIGIEVTGEGGADDGDISQMKESAEGAPVIRIVNMILLEAIHKRASDIHLECFERRMRLRYRVDGVLREGPAPPKNLQSAIISRVKVMSELDIAERRVPQDGRFRIKAQGREIDLRVSILPMSHGEKVCLRLLDKSNLSNSLDELGLQRDALALLRFAIHQPHGLILVTGPTGSGKTTTLYSALQEINNPEINITTVENPVEYQLNGINQVEINEGVGLTFSAALRSILRQDPDVVLVGETRDATTADIAVKAALTGHLVMTTLHTNDAAGAVARLVYMGIEPFLLASSLLLAQAQRLVRRICSNCKHEVDLPAEVLKINHVNPAIFDGSVIYEGRGCGRCNQSGYKGRASIMELMQITPVLRQQVLTSANADEIKKLALTEGFIDLREAGFARVKEGITTIEEVLRVTAQE